MLSYCTNIDSNQLVSEQKTTKVKIIPAIYDTGKIPYGEEKWSRYKIINIGNYNLHISKVDLECSCLSSKIDFNKPIPPKDSVVFSLAYNAKSIGPFQKLAILDMNVKETRKILILRGEVIVAKDSIK